VTRNQPLISCVRITPQRGRSCADPLLVVRSARLRADIFVFAARQPHKRGESHIQPTSEGLLRRRSGYQFCTFWRRDLHFIRGYRRRRNDRKDYIRMKKVCSTLFLVLFASASFAQSNTVLRWQQIIGVITAPGVNNPVAGISSGTTPWTTRGGAAMVNLSTGTTVFHVEGLVVNGGNYTGTTGSIPSVVGTLVCNAGTSAQATFDTSMTPFSAQGDAQYSGSLESLPTSCANPLFLIRVTPGATGRWLATGAILISSST
jgi:hypothetical protein